VQYQPVDSNIAPSTRIRSLNRGVSSATRPGGGSGQAIWSTCDCPAGKEASRKETKSSSVSSKEFLYPGSPGRSFLRLVRLAELRWHRHTLHRVRLGSLGTHTGDWSVSQSGAGQLAQSSQIC